MISLSRETEALAERVAVAQHLSVEETIRTALERQARQEGIDIAPRRPRDQSPDGIATRRARTDRFVASLAAMPMRDERSPRDILDDLNSL